jgi:Fe-S-cluster containining protein
MASRGGCDALWLDELHSLFARVDALYADWSCADSGDCCRFGSAGHQPYVTAIELFAIRHALAELAPATERRALPVLREANDVRSCPLLDRGGGCSVYADRPFGCRTYYCGRAKPGAHPNADELAELLAALQDLAARHKLGGDHVRPLANAIEGGWAG